MRKARFNRSSFVISLILVSLFSGQAQEWIDAGFESISKGSLSNSGQNLYINSKGEIKSIRRYDVNDDGYIDLMFNSTHDQENYEDATLLSVYKGGEIETSHLPVEGSLLVKSADLNKDGFPDLVFCPNKSGIQHPRRFLKIYWGTSTGWSSKLSTSMLPAHDVLTIEIADLDGDSWLDIVTLNSQAWKPNQPSGNIVRVYWGSENSFQLNDYTDMGLEGADNILSSDFNADGKADLVYSSRMGGLHWINGSELEKSLEGKHPTTMDPPSHELGSGAIKYVALTTGMEDEKKVLYGLTANHRLLKMDFSAVLSWQSQIVQENVIGSDLSVGDLDGDGQVDYVFTNFKIKKAAGGEVVGGSSDLKNDITILWGEQGGIHADKATRLSLPNAIATRIGDVNGDGILDIAAAVYQGEKRYDASSKIYFGQGNRTFVDSGLEIPTRGANSVTLVNEKNRTTAVFSNSMGGNLYETVPLYLYLGSRTGFSEKNLIKIPFTSGYESTAADINDDGYVDILAVNSMHGGGFSDKMGGVNIFTGSKDGFDFSGERQVLREVNASTSNVADLNKDGYLDIVVGFFDQKKGAKTDLVIHYGSAKGYLDENRKSISSPGRSSSPMIADLDKDGWLDIVVSSYAANKLRIFKGSKDGFHESSQEVFAMYSVIDIEVADLNADGYLDIIACHYKDHINSHHDLGMTIMWGSEAGYSNWNTQWLPSYTPLGPVVADFDGDGYLDIFAPAYHGDISREDLPMYLYWGSADGYLVENKTTFVGDSGTDALAADFDNDGQLDLAVAHHTIHGSHARAHSKIYYNDGSRFKSGQIKTTELPTPGVHWMWNKDMGNIYDRSWSESYTSRIFNWSEPRTKVYLDWEVETPRGSAIEVYYRAASDNAKIDGLDWKKVRGRSISISKKDRSFQYKLKLISPNGDRYPTIKSVGVKLK